MAYGIFIHCTVGNSNKWQSTAWRGQKLAVYIGDVAQGIVVACHQHVKIEELDRVPRVRENWRKIRMWSENIRKNRLKVREKLGK